MGRQPVSVGASQIKVTEPAW